MSKKLGKRAFLKRISNYVNENERVSPSILVKNFGVPYSVGLKLYDSLRKSGAIHCFDEFEDLPAFRLKSISVPFKEYMEKPSPEALEKALKIYENLPVLRMALKQHYLYNDRKPDSDFIENLVQDSYFQLVILIQKKSLKEKSILDYELFMYCAVSLKYWFKKKVIERMKEPKSLSSYENSEGYNWVLETQYEGRNN